ncbi:MAG: phenylacetate--CoA ligase family protein [Anaerolineae bacterium]
MSHFDTRVKELVAHAYAKAPAIKQQFDAVGVKPEDIQTANELAKIPVISKDELVEVHKNNPPFGGFLTIDPADLPRIYISPGPIFDPQPPADDPEVTLAAFRYVGFQRGDRVLNTFAYHLTPAGLLLDEGLRACGATVLPTGPGNTDLQIMMAMSLGATGFVGQPSYLMTLLDKVEEMGMNADNFPVKKALFSAEPYTPAQQARFEGDWGMTTTSAYGTADLGFIGYTRAGIEGFILTENVLLQICDPRTGELVPDGEQGEIVATTFNKSYPLIRFGTGDLGALSPDLIDGKYQHLLGLYGRSGGAIKVRGMFLHPNQLNAAKTAFPQIQRLQAIITRPENKDVVTIRLQLKNGIEAGDLPEKLIALAQNAVRLRIDKVVVVEDIDSKARTIVDEREWD